MENSRLEILTELQRKVLWLATWTIHNANHLRPNPSGLKVGGHQASSASLATVMTALYFAVLRPEDRVAVKPHASPIFHAIQYLFGQQTLEKLQNFRGFKGAQSYRVPRISTTSISPQARWVWASRKRCSRPWCRITCAPAAGAPTGPRAIWSL
jgi:pyruvate dehydrogenase complex dehydrogenase (E1) component